MTESAQTDWHARPMKRPSRRSSPAPTTGLAEEVAAGPARHGPNRIEARAGRGPLLRLALQFHQPLIYILIVSGASPPSSANGPTPG
jgi:magnesium-transporting ATPase (P-type)